MPNHVLNRIESTNPEVLKALDNFRKIYPRPEIFDKFSYTVGHFPTVKLFASYVASFTDLDPDEEVITMLAKKFIPYKGSKELTVDKEFILQVQCQLLTGESNPINWQRKHWGTKWNSYSYALYDNYCEFRTAWNHPYSVIEKLSKMFPDEELIVSYADEDLGWNLGKYSIKNGVVTQIIDEDKATRKDCHWFAICLHGLENEYQWSEELQHYVHIE